VVKEGKKKAPLAGRMGANAAQTVEEDQRGTYIPAKGCNVTRKKKKKNLESGGG